MTHTRVALVTGAAQGIGRAIALRLASDGLDVAVDDIASKTELLVELVKDIENLGRKSTALTFDVSVENEVKLMVAQTVSELGRLDVVNIVRSCCDCLSLMNLVDGSECWNRTC